MRYKLIGLAACLAALLVSAAAAQTLSEDLCRYHQHLEEPGYAPCEDHGEEVFCSHLPLIFIETGGEAIPGVPIDDGDGRRDNDRLTTAAGADALPITFRVVDQAGENHHLDDPAGTASGGTIRVRGNSSRYYDKKNYLLCVTAQDGVTEQKLPLLGMDAHDEWALHGPYLDKTLLRNYMWYNIAGEFMEYTPNVRFCEVFIDGAYQGVYVLTETVTSGDGARVNVSAPVDNTARTGYVLRVDRGSSNPDKNINTFAQYALRNLQIVDIVYPGASHLTQAMAADITQEFSDFEKSLYSFDYDYEGHAFSHHVDVQSFIDYFILNEFTCNYDAGVLSTYVYKDIHGKYKLCIWDFNSACDNYQDRAMTGEDFQMQFSLWYFMMMKDEDFVDRIIDRYRELRGGYLSDDYIDAYISDVIAWLGPAVERNFQVWGDSFQLDLMSTPERTIRSFAQAEEQLRSFCLQRGAWMDAHIEVLRQYGHESKTKKFNH